MKVKKRQAYVGNKLRVFVEELGFDISLQIALEKFFNSLIKKSTKDTYLRAFESLFNVNILDMACSLENFKRSSHSTRIEMIKVNSSLKEGQKRVACIALASFVAYLDAEIGIKFSKDNKKIDSAKQKDPIPMLINDWEDFIASLRKYNLRDALIAEILQLSNGHIFAPLPSEILIAYDQEMKASIQNAKQHCGSEITVLEPEKIRKDKPAKGTPLVSLKMVLDLQVNDISFSSQLLTFGRIYCGRLILQSYPLPKHLFSDLKKIITPKRGLVFSTANGRPVVENQLKRSFEEASKRAKLSKTVSPVMVRIPVDGLLYCPFCQKPRWKKECVCM